MSDHDDQKTTIAGGGWSDAETVGTQSEGIPYDSVGPYRLLRLIGEGGMGEVFEAEQTDPIRRLVALKVIKRGMDTRHVIARFEAERQALALMDHPAVAKVLDGGETPDGRPFFVMEYVRGHSIVEHCDRHRLSTRERLQLFAEVCDGVQHAHQKAIIHRDLKPSNVLVAEHDGKRVPKIIDFGVAKAMSQPLTERTMVTEYGVMIGTPEYMSPEQAQTGVEDVDTRSDVYSLGVMLYELIVGTLPFESDELRKSGAEGIRDKLVNSDPLRPSTRISRSGEQATDFAARRRTDPGSLKKELAGDLDWITMRAMEKDRARRYGSPAELAADIRRHLAHEPVVAGPPSAVYRTRKFVRRHRVGVAVAVATVAVMIAFAVTTAIQARRVAAERDRAETVSRFMIDTLARVDPQRFGASLIGDVSEQLAEEMAATGSSEQEIASMQSAMLRINSVDAARSLLDEQILRQSVDSIGRLTTEPVVAARLEESLGQTYSQLGLYLEALERFERAFETCTAALGEQHPYSDQLRSRVGSALSNLGRFAEAEPFLQEVVDYRKGEYGASDSLTLMAMQNLSSAIDGLGRYEESIQLLEEAIELAESDPATEPMIPARLRMNMATSMMQQSRYEEAEQLLVPAIERSTEILGADNGATLNMKTNLAQVYFDLGRYDEAEGLFSTVFESRRAALGAGHPASVSAMGNLANAYWFQMRDDDAEELYLEAIERGRRSMGSLHPDTLKAINALGQLYMYQERFDRAEPYMLESLEGARRALGEDHPDTTRTISSVATFYAMKGEKRRAIPIYTEAIEILIRQLGEDHIETLTAKGNLAIAYKQIGQYERAEALQLEALEAFDRTLGPQHPRSQFVLYNLACLEAARGDVQAALERLEQSVDRGLSRVDLFENDPDLKPLYGERFNALLERARKNASS